MPYLAPSGRPLYGFGMERPTLRQLEILAEVARVGTFRGAARHLGLSQVAVSDHIRQLESRLGCALFIRNAGTKPTLSPSGQIVLEHGRNVLFACDALISAARGAAGIVAEVAEPFATATEAVPAAPDAFSAGDMVEDATTLVPDVLPDREAAIAVDVPDESASQDMPDYSDFYTEMKEPSPGTGPIGEDPEPSVQIAEVAKAVPVSLFDAMKHAPGEDEDSSFPAGPEAVTLHRPALAQDAAAEPETDTEKPISIASHPSILSRFQDKLAAAQEAFPDRPITVDFARYTPEAVAPALSSGRSDIAIFYALGEVPGLSSEYLWSENWSLFARADHPLAQAAALRIADCVDMPVILFEESNPLRALCEACLAKAGLWPAPTVLETDDFSAIVTELMDYGEAVFPAFGVTAAQFASRPGLRRLALVEQLPGVQVRRAVSILAQDDPTISALAGLLG